jgi:hypothetical protein
MLSASLRETDGARAALRATADAQTRAVAAAAAAATDEALALASAGVDDVYDAQRAVEAALRRVQALLRAHAHQVTVYEAVVAGVVSGLKELGDVGNWCGAVEAEAREVAAVAREVAALTHID